MPVEWAMAFGEGAECAIEEVKADSEIFVHAAVVIDGAVMDVVKATGGAEP